MKSIAEMILLVERRAVRRAFALVAVLLMLAGGLALRPALAQTAQSKIASDLQQVIAATTTPSLNWAKDVNGIRYVKALVFSDSTDPDLAALRADVLARGGAVYYRYISVRGLAVLLPANQVAALAARSDVRSVSPIRLTARTASTLEATAGALTPAVRSYSSSTSYSGLDGSGIGIAVLDTGVIGQAPEHAGRTRQHPRAPGCAVHQGR